MTAALSRGTSSQESALHTLWVKSNNGADFGLPVKHQAMSGQWFGSSPLSRREIMRILDDKDMATENECNLLSLMQEANLPFLDILYFIKVE